MLAGLSADRQSVSDIRRRQKIAYANQNVSGQGAERHVEEDSVDVKWKLK